MAAGTQERCQPSSEWGQAPGLEIHYWTRGEGHVAQGHWEPGLPQAREGASLGKLSITARLLCTSVLTGHLARGPHPQG